MRVSVGHSNATAAETRLAIAAGAVSATHTFNAMRALDHREPGILGTVLTTDELLRRIDLRRHPHRSPRWCASGGAPKGPERAILVTDAMSAAGMPDGEYQLGGFPVQVEGWPRHGPTACSPAAFSRSTARSPISFDSRERRSNKALRLLSANPAAMTGLDHRAGTLAPGQAANLVAVDAAGQLVASIIGGRQANLRHLRSIVRVPIHGAAALWSERTHPSRLDASASCCARHTAPSMPATSVSRTGISGAAARSPAKNGSRTSRALPTTLPIHATGTSAVRLCLRRSFARTSSTNLNQIGRRLLQHAQRHRIAFFGQLADRRRQRRKIRTRRAVAQVHQLFDRRRSPDRAHRLQNLRRLLAVIARSAPAEPRAARSSSPSLHRPAANSIRPRSRVRHPARGQWSSIPCPQSAEFPARP